MSEQVRSVERALDIIEQLSRADGPVGPTWLAEQTGMDKSTVHRLLSTLTARGYADKRENGAYVLGAGLIALTGEYLDSLELQAEAHPILSALSANLRLPAHLGLLVGCEVVYIESLDASPTPRLCRLVGERIPAYCSSLGKCLLAFLSENALAETMANCSLRAFTQNTITHFSTLQEELCVVRARGWAIDNEEFEAGCTCAAAPIRNYRGRIIAAVSAGGCGTLFIRERLPVIVESVRQAAADISRRMGYLSE